MLSFYISFGQFNELAPWMDAQEGLKRASHKNQFEKVSNDFDRYWSTRDASQKGSGFKPFKRWQQHWKHFLKDDGSIATPGDLKKVWVQKNLLQKSENANWTSLGPYTTNVKHGQGRVNTFIIDPNNPAVFYVGAPSGGLWRSEDAGQNWVPLTDHLPQIGVSGIAIDKNNSDIIYIATGDDDARDTYSVGVMKSVDRGLTWNETGLTFSGTNGISNEIYFHPDNSDILWVSTNFGFFKTIDGGLTWKKNLTTNILDFKLKPDDPNVIYAVSRSRFYRSEDGGDSFNVITNDLPNTSGRFAVDVSPADPDVVYVLSSNTDHSFQGLYKSTDAGRSFSRTKEDSDIFGGSKQAWYDMALTVSPVDANMVFVGVIDIWRSDDGGDSFEQKNRWWDPSEPSYTHADIHFMRYFDGRLYAGTDGGIYESTDNSDSFTDLTETLNISQYYRISTAKRSSKKIVGGLQDNGGFAYSNDQWHQYHGGDGMECLINRSDDNIYYGFNQFGGVLNVTYDGGQTEGGAVASAPSDETDGSNDSGGNWITPLAGDEDGNLYAGYSKLYKLVNFTWEALSGADFGGDLDRICIAPTNSEIMLVSRANQLFRSRDGGLTFVPITHSFSTSISSIAISDQDDRVYFVSTMGMSGRVWKSTDQGDNWVDISGNLPDEPKLVIKHQDQSVLNDLYVGTSVGVYHTNDDMTLWERYDKGLPNSPVYDLEINVEDGLITAATYGRGVWQSPISLHPANHDISLLSINNNAVQCNIQPPSITVKNNGIQVVSAVQIDYEIDGEPLQEIFNTTIQPGESITLELPEKDGLSLGKHDLKVRTTVEQDVFEVNNSLSSTFTSNSAGQGQYVNTFGDLNDDVWITETLGGDTDLWERNIASTNKFKDKLNMAYITNPSGNYYDEIRSYLISPCYDLSKLENPVLKFDMIFDIELNWDVMYMEYSIDNGNSWNILGSASDPNWYNSNYQNPQRPITVGRQWTGQDLEVKEYSYPLAALANEKSVVFRFVFASDQAENGEGAAIDNFTIDATSVLSVDEFDKHDFSLFPNPSTGIFYIQRPETEPMQIRVYDVTGRLILEESGIEKSLHPLDLRRAKSGLYFLKIREGQKQLSTTLLKN